MNRKGFASILIIGIVILLIVAGAVGYFAWKKPPSETSSLVATSTVNASGTISIVGTFATPNDVYTKTFTIANFSDVNIQTWSYGGGTNAAYDAIPAGGFDPAVALFEGSGASATIYDFNDDGTCPPGYATSTTYCLDATLNEVGLSPGTYTLAVTAAPNVASGTTLGDAFSGGGSFIDPFGNARTKNFAVDIAITPSTPTPISGLQTFIDNQYDLTAKYPTNWYLNQSIAAGDPVDTFDSFPWDQRAHGAVVSVGNAEIDIWRSSSTLQQVITSQLIGENANGSAITIDGIRGLKYVSDSYDSDAKVDQESIDVFIPYNGFIYDISLDDYGDAQSIGIFNAFLNSIQFTQTAIDTSGWKTYTNTPYGFSLKYPPNLTIQSSTGYKETEFSVCQGSSCQTILHVDVDPIELTGSYYSDYHLIKMPGYLDSPFYFYSIETGNPQDDQIISTIMLE